jgi:DNA/RNA-binding domain of Phe-tRNA-synthetase-like protein
MMGGELELVAAPGFIEPRLKQEFPGLALAWLTVEVRHRASPRWVVQRLRALSDRVHGASVVAMRTHPIPHAYRTFFRQIGLDPDSTRIPSEEAAVARLLHGGFRSTDPLTDAMLIALVETGVSVWALNSDLVDAGGLGIRTTSGGERFGTVSHSLPAGRLVVADSRQVHALLFGPVAPGHAADARTRRVALFAVGVEGVPAIHVEEALWTAAEALSRV